MYMLGPTDPTAHNSQPPQGIGPGDHILEKKLTIVGMNMGSRARLLILASPLVLHLSSCVTLGK